MINDKPKSQGDDLGKKDAKAWWTERFPGYGGGGGYVGPQTEIPGHKR
jgi:hypothetical protein